MVIYIPWVQSVKIHQKKQIHDQVVGFHRDSLKMGYNNPKKNKGS